MTDAGTILASGISYLDVVIIFSVFVYVLNTYLDFRQVTHETAAFSASLRLSLYGLHIQSPSDFAPAVWGDLKASSSSAFERILPAS